jgi:TPR repeat protein
LSHLLYQNISSRTRLELKWKDQCFALFMVGAMILISACSAAPSASSQNSPLQTQLNAGRDAYRQQNYDAAFQTLLPLAQKDYPAAEYAVGYMYFYGQGITADIDMAQFWMRKAVQAGYPQAAQALAQIDQVAYKSAQPFSLPVPSLHLKK